MGSATIGPETRGAIAITLASTCPSRVHGFARYERQRQTPVAMAARTIAPVRTYRLIGFMACEPPAQKGTSTYPIATVYSTVMATKTSGG